MTIWSCVGCATHLQRGAKFCSYCGRAVRRDEGGLDDDNDLDGAVSSAGRRPAGRPRRLPNLGDGRDFATSPSATFLEQITIAEEALAACEQDAWQRTGELRAARANSPAYPAARELDAHQRHAYVVFQLALDRHERSQRAYEAARNRLNRMLADWDAVSRPDLGLPPGQGSDDDIIAIRGSRSRF